MRLAAIVDVSFCCEEMVKAALASFKLVSLSVCRISTDNVFRESAEMTAFCAPAMNDVQISRNNMIIFFFMNKQKYNLLRNFKGFNL